MNKKTTNVSSILFVLVLITVVLAIPSESVLAKDLHLPPGADRISYYSNGNVSINIPAGLPNYPASATNISFSASRNEGDTLIGATGASTMYVWLYSKTIGRQFLHWEPYAVITTSSQAADFLRILFRGTIIFLDATLYGYPPSYSTNNVILVDEGDLKVERHGDNILARLEAPQQIKRPLVADTFFTLPAFSMQLNNYGGSIHYETTVTMSVGARGLSNYTLESEGMGFYANGAFTCNSPGWSYNAAPMTEAFITMHGTQTYYPPP